MTVIMNVTRYLYTLIYCLLAPYLLFRLWWKGRSLPAYRSGIGQRFSLDTKGAHPVDIWVHAVSLGEVIAITPLIEALLKKKQKVLVTTMTPTGAQRLAQQFGDRLIHRYVPYEIPFVLRRFFTIYTPKVGIIVETELWPNLIHYARRAGVSLVLFNARLSEQSCRGYSKVRWVFRPLLNQFHGIYTQSQEDAARFRLIGAEEDRVHVIGNIKFDLAMKQIDYEPFLAMKSLWGEARVVLILASTHEDEEQQVLSRLRLLQDKIPSLLLLVAPRHPERFNKIVQLALSMGFNVGRRSDLSSLNAHNEVVVLDSLGELLGFYHISDYSFVGGSLAPIGGHNVLEPIAMKIPVFTGRYVSNFKSICQALLAAKAIIQVGSADELVDQLVTLHHDKERKQKLQQSATAVLYENQGALQRYLAITENLLMV